MKTIPPEIRELLEFEYDDKLAAAPELRVRYKPKPAPCPDCQTIIGERRIWRRLIQAPFPHWRETCKVCNNIRNPVNNQFDVPELQADRFIRKHAKYFRRDK